MKHLILTALAALAVSGLAAPKNPLRARTAGLYNRPTAHQLERCIAAAQGVAAPTNLSLYGTPTFSQVERLITALGSRSNETGVASWATAGNAAPITNVTINGSAMSITDRVASGTVVTCNPLPDGTLHENVSTLTFCKSLATNPTVVKGMMYMGHAGLTEGYGNSTFPGGGEITVKCLQADRDLTKADNVSSSGCVILELTFTSTNTGLRHWMCVYEYFGTGHHLNDGVEGNGEFPDGKPAFGTAAMPWYGIPFSPFPGQEAGPNPLARGNTAALLTDIDNCTNVMKNQTFNLSNDSDLKRAVQLLVERLGGTATNP